MPKNNNNKQAKSKKSAAKRGQPKPSKKKGGMRASLDQAARDYVRLVKDPCNAPLTKAIWPGAGGSFIGRFESDAIFFSGATETAGALVWCPTACSVYTGSAAWTSDTASTSLSYVTNGSPGYGFLANGGLAQGVRCVAACLQVMYPGTELNRSGVVGLGVSQFSSFVGSIATASGGMNQVTNAAAIRSLCAHTERMPDTMSEVIWYPGTGDMSFQNVKNTAIPAVEFIQDVSDTNALYVSASGFPVSTGIRVRMVAVYEWQPIPSVGLVAQAEFPRSRNNINEVLMALNDSGGTNWFINSFKKAMPYIGSAITYGAKLLGPAMAAL